MYETSRQQSNRHCPINKGSRMKVGKVAVKMVIHSKKIVCN